MTYAPVALFAYRRPDHLRRAIAALRANPESASTRLYVFSDGRKGTEDAQGVEAVRKIVREIDGFSEVTVVTRSSNLGLARSIVEGVGEVVGRHGRVIVVEDDLEVAPYFLRYMNESLELYANDERVASVHGYVYPVQDTLPETFFLRGTDCWGWGTWARAWLLFEPDGTQLLARLRSEDLIGEFDLEGAFPNSRMLEDQIAGRNDSWAIRWHAAVFLANRLTLYPGRSLVQNIGNDSSGTHYAHSEHFRVTCSGIPIRVGGIPVGENAEARASFVRFGRSLQTHSNTQVTGRSALKRALKAITPPLIWDGMRNAASLRTPARTEISPQYSGNFASWGDAVAVSDGYGAQPIFERTRAALLEVKAGKARFERDSVLLDKPELPFFAIAGLLRTAALEGRLSVLDFGGSLGSSYFQCRSFLAGIPNLRWAVVEQPAYVACGSKEFADSELVFHDSIEKCILAERPNVALLSGVVHYLSDPYGFMHEFVARGIRSIIVDRMPFLRSGSVRLTVQRVPPSIYRASYPAWFLSEARLLQIVEEAGYHRLAEYDGADRAELEGEVPYFKGFIWAWTGDR